MHYHIFSAFLGFYFDIGIEQITGIDKNGWQEDKSYQLECKHKTTINLMLPNQTTPIILPQE